jgi:ribosomal protein S10
MAKVTNNFLKGKMNKDLDERLVPKGEYREAQNILITQSEGSDVGAIENILGNALAKGLVPGTTDPLEHPLETIGYYADRLNNRIFWFITNFTGSSGDNINVMSRPSPTAVMKILMVEENEPNIKVLVDGPFLNFSKNHLITGVNLIDDLLFWTDNYNQPRKINITRALENSVYYTKEEQISVAKVAPYLAPILHDNSGNGDATTLTNHTNVDSDYLKDRFVRFSYRYKYEDGEYTTMAPFTQIVFKPLNDSKISNVLTEDYNVQDVYTKTIVDIMKNDYNQVELRIPLPGEENSTLIPQSLPGGGYNWDNNLRISKIEILIKESDQDVVKVIKEIDVTNNSGNLNNDFSTNIDIYTIAPEGADTYYRYVYKFNYKSEEPYKILEDKQITRVFDQVPVRAKAQEISGNRIIYGNYTENYKIPKDQSGKKGINYVINNSVKGAFERLNLLSNQGLNQYNKNTYKYNSLKQRRTYQVGIVLADKFGRQSPVILTTNNSSFNTDTITIPNRTEDLSSKFNGEYSWSDDELAIGEVLNINFQDDRIVPDNVQTKEVYNGDINDPKYNPYGWYSWKVVVKQQEQEYYNIYTSHPADSWNNESNNIDDYLGSTWISLYGDNINKITKDLGETGEIREDVAGSDTLLFPKVVKNISTDSIIDLDNISISGNSGQDPIEVMTIGTAREQNLLTDSEVKDQDRVHDFIMAKRNPLVAQIKSLGSQATKNKPKYKINVDVIEENEDDRTYFKIGDGATINPFIRPGQQITHRRVLAANTQEYSQSGSPTHMGRPAVTLRVKLDDQNEHGREIPHNQIYIGTGHLGDDESWGGNFSDGSYAGGMRVGQYIEFESTFTRSTGKLVWHGDEWTFRHPILKKVELNHNKNHYLLHFDRDVWNDDNLPPNLADNNDSGFRLNMTLYDPLLIKEVDNITENGQVYQRIRMNHDHKMGGGDSGTLGQDSNENPIKISIQNYEEEPIAVGRGLTVLETNPVKSKLDIFYETSTSGLVSDLNSFMQLSTSGPTDLIFTQDVIFDEESGDPEDSFTIGTFSANSDAINNDDIEFILQNVERGDSGYVSGFQISGNSLQVTKAFHYKPTEEEPNANKFYITFQAFDGGYTEQTIEIGLKNISPTIEFNGEMPLSLEGATQGSAVATGNIYNGSTNSEVNMKDLTLEISSNKTWASGDNVFTIEQVNNSNLFHIKINFYDDDANSVLYLQQTYADANGIMNIIAKVKDAGSGFAAEAEAIVSFNFESSFLETYMVGKSLFPYNDGSNFCQDHWHGAWRGPILVSKGTAINSPYYIENYTPTGSTVEEPNIMMVSPVWGWEVKGIQLHQGNRIWVQPYTGNYNFDHPEAVIINGETYVPATNEQGEVYGPYNIIPNIFNPIKYFKSNITDNSGGSADYYMEKIFQHFEIDVNGYIINEPEDCNFD